MLGLSYDWSREINSSDPDYYKWTQWFFLLLYKNGLAYRAKAKVNFCPKCQTVLANEQVISGKCERCETKVIQKDLEQWFFRITDFIEDNDKTSGLISGLDKVNWPESTKAAQRNWIGKSEGAIIKFFIKTSPAFGHPSLIKEGKGEVLEVFTTRLDTIYGCTYCVIAPEHEIINNYETGITNYAEVKKYIIAAKNKTELERMETKEKTGVEIKGIKVINPFNNEEISLFVADYVLGHYGTGAVMAVPAHDERDFEFAKKYNLPIRQSIAPYNLDEHNPPRKGSKNTIRKVVHIILENSKGEVLTLNLKDEEWGNDKPKTLIIGGVEEEESLESTALREVKEETGYINVEIVKIHPIEFHAEFFAAHKNLNRYVKTTGVFCKLKSEKQVPVNKKEKELHDIVWVKRDMLPNSVTIPDDIFLSKAYVENVDTFTNSGILINSGKFNGLKSEEARKKMTEWLEKNNLGSRKINYKLRDWLVSRQRYWGAPIPIIYCRKCWEISNNQFPISKQIPNSNGQNFKTTVIDEKEYAIIPVLEDQLPVKLPDDVDFKPTGESPLKYSKKFHDATCPMCGNKKDVFRESDTMDTFVCSSWYYFRYTDPKNSKVFADKEKIKKWLPVDIYVGGAEHTVLHLLYSRFFTKALHKLGYIDFDEPFLKLRHQGIILGEDNYKMSKSRGNVINPDDVINKYGADSLRMFEMFMGPLEDMKPWNTKGIVGIKRFLEKTNKYYEFSKNNFQEHSDGSVGQLLEKTIKKVTEDIENFRFNTAISQMMIFINYVYKTSEELKESKSPAEKKMGELSNIISKMSMISKDDFEKFIIILSPFAPHFCEELWKEIGHTKSIFLQKWPEYDLKLIKDEEIDLVIQVNGRARDIIKINAGIPEKEALRAALASEKVKKFMKGKEVKKKIFVKGKLINIVV